MRRTLFRRRLIRVICSVCSETDVTASIVGGAVRDAFLGRKSKDIDLSVPSEKAAGFCQALAAATGGHVLSLGRAPRRVFRIITAKSAEVDIWEVADQGDTDTLRRDFTINAMSFDLPGSEFRAPREALNDLAEKFLRLPRPGVLLEDPLRVLRAARFSAQLPGFRLHPSALPEAIQASNRLLETASERRLAELDKLLACPVDTVVPALASLERLGALEILMPSSNRRDRTRGIRLFSKTLSPAVSLRRVLLLWPQGPDQTSTCLVSWRVPKRDLTLAEHLGRLSKWKPSGGSQTERAVRLIRRAEPFVAETLEFWRLTGTKAQQCMAAHAAPLCRSARALDRILNPRRPMEAEEIALAAGIEKGPQLGKLLNELDSLLAAGILKDRRSVLRYLESSRR